MLSVLLCQVFQRKSGSRYPCFCFYFVSVSRVTLGYPLYIFQSQKMVNHVFISSFYGNFFSEVNWLLFRTSIELLLSHWENMTFPKFTILLFMANQTAESSPNVRTSILKINIKLPILYCLMFYCSILIIPIKSAAWFKNMYLDIVSTLFT